MKAIIQVEQDVAKFVFFNENRALSITFYG